MDAKSLLISKAVFDVMSVYTEQEIGYNAEVNLDRLRNYVNSFATALAYQNADTLEECVEVFISEILAGEPVWRLLNIPKWTADMLEREFAELVAEREAAMKRKYKCLTCKYYKREETGLGLIEECNYEKEKQVGKSMLRHRSSFYRMERRGPFELKTRCNKYERVEANAVG